MTNKKSYLEKKDEHSFKLELFDSNNYKNDFSTHYLHNHQSGVSYSFKKNTFSYVNESLKKEPPTIKVAQKALQYSIFDLDESVPFLASEKPKFKFVDLFAGIGGFRLALQNLEGKCVFTSEWDKYSKQTYQANFGEIPFGDITKSETKKHIPDNFDVLCAGFPCQAFSIAGRRSGFEDTRGTLFFDVAEIIRKKQPKAIFLENVKGLRNHDKGKTLATILNVLREDLGYYVPEPKIINAKDFGVPQNRERIFIVGFHKDTKITCFEYPDSTSKDTVLEDILEKDEVSVKYYLSTTYIDTLRKHKARHASKGNGFGYEIIPNDRIANAVVCGGMGRERNLVFDDRLNNLGVTLFGRAFRSNLNLFARTSRKGFPLQSLTQKLLA